MKLTVSLFTLTLLYCGSLNAQVVISTQRQSFTSNQLQSADALLKQRSDTLPYRIYYVPGTWNLPPDKKKVDTAMGVSKLLNTDVTFPQSETFTTSYSKAYARAKSYFDSLKDKDSSIVILDHIGLKDGSKDYVHELEFVFGDSIPASLRQAIQEYRPNNGMSFVDNSLGANDKYLEEYTGFLAEARQSKTAVQYPRQWPFVQMKYFDVTNNFYTSEVIGEPDYTDVKAYLATKCPNLVLTFPPDVKDFQYEQGMHFYQYTPYRMAPDKPVAGTKPDDKSIKWKLNDKDVTKLDVNGNPDFDNCKDLFVNGINQLVMTGKYTQPAFKNQGTKSIAIKFTYGDENLIKYYIMAARKYGFAVPYKKYDIPVYIGDPKKETEMYVGDSLKLQLFDKTSNTQVELPVWTYNNAETRIKEQKLKLIAGVEDMKVQQEADPLPLSIKLELIDTSGVGVILVQNPVPVVDISGISTADSIIADKLYKAAVVEIRKKDPAIYTLVFQKTDLSVHIRPGTDPQFAGAGAGRLMGHTLSGSGVNNLNSDLLDTLSCVFDKAGLIKGARLVARLSDNEKKSMELSALEHTLNEKADEMLTRVAGVNARFADLSKRMRAEILAGNYIAAKIDSMRYEVERKDVTKFAVFNQSTTNVYLNFTNLYADVLGTTPTAVTKTFIHEMMHAAYIMEEPLIWLKWNTIVRKFRNNHAVLGDLLGANVWCSEGSGHETYNPENQRVCTISNKY